jgi:hypothetical protein
VWTEFSLAQENKDYFSPVTRDIAGVSSSLKDWFSYVHQSSGGGSFICIIHLSQSMSSKLELHCDGGDRHCGNQNVHDDCAMSINAFFII